MNEIDFKFSNYQSFQPFNVMTNEFDF